MFKLWHYDRGFDTPYLYVGFNVRYLQVRCCHD